MKYNELQVSANKDKIRVGRGISAGLGKLLVVVLKVRELEQERNFVQLSKVVKTHLFKRLQKLADSNLCENQLKLYILIT